MIKVNIREAKAHLSEHLDRLEKGEEDVLVICRGNRPIAEVRALPRPRETERPIFLRDRRFKLSRSFFSPLPAALLDAFEGKE